MHLAKFILFGGEIVSMKKINYELSKCISMNFVELSRDQNVIDDR